MVLDGGANIGLTALECLDAGAKKVVAVEPLPALFERLQRLTKSRVCCVNKAISAEEGVADFFVSTQHNQGSSLKSEMIHTFPRVFGDQIITVSVGLTTIDRLTEEFGYFDVWKLDIEGAEIDALKGAIKTLGERPPRVIIAELFDDFRNGFRAAIHRTHPFAYRASIREDIYALDLRDAAAAAAEGVYQTSPMYIFLASPL